MKREIIFGLLWGVSLSLILLALLFSVSNAAEELMAPQIKGDIEISISADSVRIDLDKADTIRSITVSSDSIVEAPDGIVVGDKLLIENGRINIDGTVLNASELRRVKINQEQETSSTWGHDEKKRPQYRRRRLVTAYGDRGGDMVSFRAVEVDSAASVQGDVVAIAGDAEVAGEVFGDVVSVFGDVFLRNGADVHGDVAAPFGQIHREPSVRVRGESMGRAELGRERNDADFGLYFRFNRVEGLALGPKLTYDDSKDRYPSVEVGGSYAFSLKRWQYELGVDHRIGKKAGPFFNLALFQVAETSDRWLLGEDDNTLKALVFSEDAYDYYWSRGFAGEAGIFYRERFKAGFLLDATRISNLRRNTRDGIFGGKNFRPNWATTLPDSADLAASVGDLKEYGLTATYDSRDDKHSPASGLYANIQLLKAADGDSADFDYALVHYETKGYFPVGRNQTVMVRLRAGHSDDRLPLFRRFFLGGIGSLRGYDYKEFEGNRYALFNIDYIWLFHQSDLGAGVFFDAGKAAFGADAFDSADIKTDIGLCFLVTEAIRIDLAQRLDDLDRGPQASFRFDMLF